ncbi:acyltransferase family protein [Microbacterium sp. SMR1]|uniref:acyltransferase family protein n=1 Tax=Microbacterium sp. SMR1 TaxID=1497340 RepID=UPI0015ECBA77|nr:acyltransferase family protein [Microbacterium sp. SMR1]
MGSLTGRVSGSAGPRVDADRWGYRADIDGLRAVAILLVVTYHVWFGRVSGGVDVFLMLSAFFLTRTFLHRIHTGAPPDIARRLIGTFRRLLPAAAVTLLLVLLLARLFYPATTWRSLWEQTWASLLYVQNWILAADAVDYYNRGEAPSPLQHFWSLSVQGQAFVLWAVLFALCLLIIRRFRRPPDAVVAVVFGAVFVVSLGYSVVRTDAAQQLAYFDTGARLWEFAAGSLLVVALPYLRPGPTVSAVLGWVGIGGLLACGVLLDVEGGFPGYLALWPVVCAAMIVISGTGDAGRGPARFLASRPLRLAGRDAYALYLVHWPVLVTWLVVRERTEVGALGGVAIVLASLAGARLLTFAVDHPVRQWRRSERGVMPSVAVVAVAALVVLVPVGTWQGVTAYREQRIAEQQLSANPGAHVLFDDEVSEPDPELPMIPLATAIEDEWVQLELECSGVRAITDDILHGSCFERPGTQRASELIAVIGDSHAQQMTAALVPIAEQRGWGVITLVRGGCAMGLDDPGFDPEFCPQWREAAIRHVEAIKPSAVMTIVTAADASDEDERLRPGIERFLDRMDAADIPIIAVRDNPRFGYDMFGCVIESDDPERCSMPRGSSLAAANPARILQRDSITHVDLTEWICPDDVCPAVVGNVAVYRDDNHLSSSYARTLAPVLETQLGELTRG